MQHIYIHAYIYIHIHIHYPAFYTSPYVRSRDKGSRYFTSSHSTDLTLGPRSSVLYFVFVAWIGHTDDIGSEKAIEAASVQSSTTTVHYPPPSLVLNPNTRYPNPGFYATLIYTFIKRLQELTYPLYSVLRHIINIPTHTHMHTQLCHYYISFHRIPLFSSYRLTSISPRCRICSQNAACGLYTSFISFSI